MNTYNGVMQPDAGKSEEIAVVKLHIKPVIIFINVNV